MDGLGAAFAGKRLATADLVAALRGAGLRDADARVRAFTEGKVDTGGPLWSITAFEDEPEQTLIVHACGKEPVLHRECAELLARNVAARFRNCAIPIRSERDTTEADLAAHHVVFVGRPAASPLLFKL